MQSDGVRNTDTTILSIQFIVETYIGFSILESQQNDGEFDPLE